MLCKWEGDNIPKIMACNVVEQIMVPIGAEYREKSCGWNGWAEFQSIQAAQEQGSPSWEKSSRGRESAKVLPKCATNVR